MNLKDSHKFSKSIDQSIRQVFVILAMVCLLSLSFRASDDVTNAAGTAIVNRAAATYQDDSGTTYQAVSPTITVTVSAVPAITVTPDDNASSDTISPNDKVTRVFRICNSGNTEDVFIPTKADVTAPATINTIYFDNDNSGTVTSGDTPVSIGQTPTPRLAPGKCVGVLMVVDTGAVTPQSQIAFHFAARTSLATPGTGNYPEDEGTILNSVGDGVTFGDPDNPKLRPFMRIDDSMQAVAVEGQILNYKVRFRNNSAIVARSVRFLDELPDELEYVPGTLRLNGVLLTDGADGDEGSVNGNRIELLISEIAPGAVVQIEYQVRLKRLTVNGRAIINTASIWADNASIRETNETVIIFKPIGVVYAANSRGKIRINGAKITISTDENGLNLVTNTAAGFAPNTENANPFTTDANGEFSFSPAITQTSDNGILQYYINIAVPNYRARRLSVILIPTGKNGLYNVTIRSLDGQTLAVAGGFELTSSNVELNNLFALVFNIPLFDVSTLEIDKSADKQYAQIGDIISYRVQIHNATASPIGNAVVRDTLPPGFVYASGTAQIQNGASTTRIEPQTEGSVMTFSLGEMTGGASATISYRVRVGASTQEGMLYNSAIAAGVELDGATISTQPARAGVQVRGGAFSLRQVLIGRVFEDKNGNGKFDLGERPVAGARIYLDNGQSVITDSKGQYNIPAVNQGSFVVSLDPLTLPKDYKLLDENGRRSSKSWTRLLRTPLGGGALLRQNFAIAPETAAAMISAEKKVLTADGTFVPPAQNAKNDADAAAQAQNPVQIASLENKIPLNVPEKADKPGEKQAAETFTVETTEDVAAVKPGELLVLSPKVDSVIMSPALSVKARVAKDWNVEAEVNGEKIGKTNIGETRVDNRNQVTTYLFVGMNLQPGINNVKLTAVGADGTRGMTSEFKVYGRGKAERIEIIPAKTNVQNGGREAVPVEIRAFDRLGNPAADGQITIEASAGRLYLPKKAAGKDAPANVSTELPRQQAATLENGRATIYLIADNTADKTHLKAVAGNIEAAADVRFSAEIRPTLLVGLAELSVGRSAPEIANSGDDVKYRDKVSFYYRGQVLGNNLLTLAYDSHNALNRIAGRDRFGGFDPLDRTYPVFGDSSQRFEDAQSNSKVYARLDHKNSYAMFGDMETDMDKSVLAGYSRKLTGVKLHLENNSGDFISVTGARPDTAFARDVFPGGGLSLMRLSHINILQGSEVLNIETRDRRNPETILSRETLIRSVDYNLDPQTGEIFFLRPIAAFDFQLNLTQIVAAYEYRADSASDYVYTGRASRHFKSLGLRLGASFVNQQQNEIGAYNLGGIDGEKDLRNGGKLSFEAALSSGRFASGVNVFDFYDAGSTAFTPTDTNSAHNGTAFALKLDQPVRFMHSSLRADFTRSTAGFYNPFGATVAAGVQRYGIELLMRPSSRRNFTLGFLSERNHTSNVDNSRTTLSFLWSEQWRDNLRTTLGFDHRQFNDNRGDQTTDSNLLTANIEYKPIEKVELSVRREQNLSDADPTYPTQTTFSAKYALNQDAKLFVTQRLASGAITPIGDFSGSAFSSTASRNETAFGIETKLPRLGALNGRYQVENGINGTDSFAVIGLQNRWALKKTVALETGFERGFLLRGNDKSFNSVTLGGEWTPLEGFRANARYELRDRNGFGQLFSLGAVGKIGDNWTTLARGQFARNSYNGRGGTASDLTGSAAYRPLNSDKYALLFSYNHRDTLQQGSIVNNVQQVATRDRYDTLSSDGLYQVNKGLEIYGRFALRFNGNGDTTNLYASALTYLGQARAQQRLGNHFDLAVESRWLSQPVSKTFRRSSGAELGYWLMPDLRLGVGYNFTQANRYSNSLPANERQFHNGAYFTITSKLSNLFNLFGTSRQGLKNQNTPGGN